MEIDGADGGRREGDTAPRAIEGKRSSPLTEELNVVDPNVLIHL